MPMRRELYPVDWAQIAREIKEACDWQCQVCGVQCRRPGDAYDHTLPELTCAHWDHDYHAPTIFVVACCAPCHLRHDALAHARTRRRRRRERQHQAGQRQFLLKWRLFD